MAQGRKPNTTCTNCDKKIYVRPGQLAKHNGYCSKSCRYQFRNFFATISCGFCNKVFTPRNSKTAKFCSRSCSNYSRRGASYSKDRESNSSKRRLAKIKSNFDLKSCMISDCNYSKTYDIHRLVEGKDGGRYEIGNMFAICPNHHAEIHRKITKVIKINDYTLRIVN